MTQLPLLVDNLINWYIWKAKIKECNQEYHKIVTYSYLYGRDSRINFYPIDKNLLPYHHEFQYRIYSSNRISFMAKFIRNFTSYLERIVAILPERYLYSSGMSDPFGYRKLSDSKHVKNCRKINSRIIDSVYS
jgi:hypothetical protein